MSRGKHSKNWNESDTSILITLVEQKPDIWRKTSKNNKNTYKLAKDWEEISKTLDLPKKLLQDKWKALYRRMQSEVAKCPQELSGAGATEHSSDWEHFERMRFVLDSILWGESSGNLTDVLETADPISNMSQRTQRTSAKELLNIEEKKVNLLESIEKSMEKETLSDELLFVKTLLPYIQKIPEQKRLLFREDLLKLVRKYVEDEDCVIVENEPYCAQPRKRQHSRNIKIEKEDPYRSVKIEKSLMKIKREKTIIYIEDDEENDVSNRQAKSNRNQLTEAAELSNCTLKTSAEAGATAVAHTQMYSDAPQHHQNVNQNHQYPVQQQYPQRQYSIQQQNQQQQYYFQQQNQNYQYSGQQQNRQNVGEGWVDNILQEQWNQSNSSNNSLQQNESNENRQNVDQNRSETNSYLNL